MSHEEIFGGEEYVTVEREVERDGVLGPYLDVLLGKKTRLKTESRRHGGMNAKTLQAYMELLNDYYEEKEKEQKKAEMKQQMRGGATMG